MKDFVCGVNLGGWLSQYATYDHEHFRTFITRADIDQIASWGLDHVRLPVDYPVLESDDAVGVPLEEGYAYVEQCLQWCADAGLAVILDVHDAPGFTFRNDLEEGDAAANTLFTDPAVQDRLVALWETIVRRFADAPVPIIFELLNEVTLPDNGPRNALASRTRTRRGQRDRASGAARRPTPATSRASVSGSSRARSTTNSVRTS